MNNASIKEFVDPYRHVGKSICIYWKLYGGKTALLHSPYVHFSIIVSLCCYPIWATGSIETAWYSFCLSIIPNLLGFTLGGYAILLAFGNERFLALLAESDDDNEKSPYMGVNATFIHFILVQTLSLFIALIESVWCIKAGVFAFIGFTLFLYALSTSIAAALSILRLARWFDVFLRKTKGEK